MSTSKRKLIILNGIVIGQETKGVTAARLVKLIGAKLMIRYGGCNGSHYVQSGTLAHSFSHFASGTFQGVKTYLVNMVIDPFMLFEEALALEKLGVSKNMFERIYIHQGCLSITPYHGAISRLREHIRALKNTKKGTVGLGVGEAIKDSKRSPEFAIRFCNFADEDLEERIERIRQLKLKDAFDFIHQQGVDELDDNCLVELEMLHDKSLVAHTAKVMRVLHGLVQSISNSDVTHLIHSNQPIVVEGSHGVLLHPYYGFAPHVSQVDATGEVLLKNFKKLVPAEEIVRLGVLRSYMHRIGAGPLVSQDDIFGDSVDSDRDSGETFLGPLRIGPLDFIKIRYALACIGGPEAYDGLVMSHLDDLDGRTSWPVCTAYQFVGDDADVSTYFEIENGRVSAIKVHPDTRDENHLKHQMRLTELLAFCKPIIEHITPANGRSLREEFISRVELETGVNVVMIGHGPDVTEFTLLPKGQELFS